MKTQLQTVAPWHPWGQFSPPEMSSYQKIFSFENFRPEVRSLKLKREPFWEKLGTRSKFCARVNLLSRQAAASVGKLRLPVPSNFYARQRVLAIVILSVRMVRPSVCHMGAGCGLTGGTCPGHWTSGSPPLEMSQTSLGGMRLIPLTGVSCGASRES